MQWEALLLICIKVQGVGMGCRGDGGDGGGFHPARIGKPCSFEHTYIK